jgi:hypothetical protein
MTTPYSPFAGTSSASYTPGVNLHFQAGMTAPDDGTYEDLQRESGGYQPGQYPKLEDQITQGSDDES